MNTFHTRTRPDDSVKHIDTKVGYHGNHIESGNHGLTKRELIAMHLMAGIIGDPARIATVEDCAKLAIKATTALIAALNGDL